MGTPVRTVWGGESRGHPQGVCSHKKVPGRVKVIGAHRTPAHLGAKHGAWGGKGRKGRETQVPVGDLRRAWTQGNSNIQL